MSETVIIHNPKSGSGNHADEVRKPAALHGYDFELTESAGDAITLAREAAEAGATTVVAAGGDGTVNEVVRGIDRADAFDAVTVGILPVGTGNNFAEQLGIVDVETAFSVLEDGERRRIDIGRAGERPFVNSCVAGLTANSSSETSDELKKRFGVMAYVITTIQSVADFESHPLTVDIEGNGGGTTAWAGEALCVIVGNGRRFTTRGSRQADVEDGLFDVAVIEDASALDLVADAVSEGVPGRDSSHIVRSKTPSLTIQSNSNESIRFSLDGEIVTRGELSLDSRSRTLTVAVGDAYDPSPE